MKLSISVNGTLSQAIIISLAINPAFCAGDPLFTVLTIILLFTTPALKPDCGFCMLPFVEFVAEYDVPYVTVKLTCVLKSKIAFFIGGTHPDVLLHHKFSDIA